MYYLKGLSSQPKQLEFYHVNPVNPSRYYKHQQLKHLQFIRSAQRVQLCVSYDCPNKQQLFSYTLITDGFL
jgi:hypothetical protein